MAGRQTQYAPKRAAAVKKAPKSLQPIKLQQIACNVMVSPLLSDQTWFKTDVTPTSSMVGGYLVLTAFKQTAFPIVDYNATVPAPPILTYPDGAAGNVDDGAHWYKIIQKSTTTGEVSAASNGTFDSGATLTVAAPNSQVGVTPIEALPTDFEWYYYRTKAGDPVTGTYYFVHNDTAALTDTTADSSLIVQIGSCTAGSVQTSTPYDTSSTSSTPIDPTVVYPAVIYVPQDGYGFTDISWWVCSVCGLAWRKKQLTRHEVTGKLVCPNDYDKLGVFDSPEQRYREEATKHAADLFEILGEWP